MTRFVFLAFLILAETLCAQMVVSAPEVDALLGKMIAQEEIAQLKFMTELIPRAQRAVEVADAALKSSRKIYEIGRSIADYDPERLFALAKDDFCGGFPGSCPLIENALKEITALEGVVAIGKEKVFAYRNSIDKDAGKMIKGLATGMMKAYVYPKLSGVIAKYAGEGVSAVDEIYAAALAKKGMAQDLLAKTVQATALQSAMKEFVAEAARTHSLAAQGSAIQLGIEQLQARDLETLANIQKADFVRKELEEELVKQGVGRFIDAYRQKSEQMKKEKSLLDLLNGSTKEP